MKYSIILPICNEEGAISELIAEISAVMGRLGSDYEIVAVDDGSRDKTPEILSSLSNADSHLKVVTLRRNFGQTAALTAGFDHAEGEVFITMDSDGQNNPADIPVFVRKIEEGYDCVMGWRRDRKDSFFTRKIPSRLANLMIRILWSTDVRDFGCSFKVFRSEILKDLSFYGEMHRLLGLLLIGVGAKIVSLPVDHRPRTTGKSKYGLERTIKVVLDLVTVWFLDRFKSKPIHVFGGVGTAFFAGAGACSLIAIVQKVMTEFSLNRNPLFFLSIFLGIVGIQFIGIGLLSELLSRIYFESTQRRPYAVRSVFSQSMVEHRSRNAS